MADHAVPSTSANGSAEEVGLINGQVPPKDRAPAPVVNVTGYHPPNWLPAEVLGSRSRKAVVLYSVGILSLLAVTAAAGYSLAKGGNFDASQPGNDASRPRARNVIMMISDGFGPASETFARSYHQTINEQDVSWKSPLDELLVGASRTRSSNSLITDSAAGATAFSCALKSYNGAIGVAPDETPCGTVLEAAKRKGLLTGLVATSRITHATPAAFSAHVVQRNMEDLIAQQQIGNYSMGRVVDLMLGGGACHFVPMSAERSCRTDNVDVLRAAREDYGFTHLSSAAELEALTPGNTRLPVLGLFADDHMEYEIDRSHSHQPALADMATKALDLLKHASAGQSEGFFLMIEGSRIDMAAHANDPATHVHEVEAYWEAVRVVKKFVDENPGTVLVSTSDHETGGLTIGRQLNTTYPEYVWHPEALTPVTRSMEKAALELLSYNAGDERRRFVRKVVLPQWLGVTDATDKEIKQLSTHTDYYELRETLTEMISRRALIGWSTHGHTGVDVNLYAYGAGADFLRGNHENTEVGEFIVKALDLDLQAVTDHIQNDSTHQPRPDVPEKFLYRRSDCVHEMHYH
ncbi:vacuolar alkaline phosphatase [Tieghemiomyces parasiticus]|uniref:Alkaline phosphatase n=1 Tax=Tieghemiomyces parasiticus TaxID=78921 RepID=A0A9W8A771_9FUNG|nr:vacuolar alkaline phosphatase [Tieghemiomyces parasiticus]